MRDVLFGIGLVALAVFGSALDSTGWAGWVAIGGVVMGMALMVIASY